MRLSPRLPSPSPLPTSAPAPELVRRQLHIRQADIDNTSTCGFEKGNPDYPETCDFGVTCAVNTLHSAHGCCEDVNDCTIVTSCVNYSSLSACDSDCQDNPYIIKCTEKANPYCYTNSYPEVSLKGYNCGTSSNAVYLILLTPTSQAQIASSLSGVAASLRYSLSHTTITNGAQLTAINEEIASLTSAAAVIATESVGEGALNEDSASASESDVTFSWSQPAQPSLPDASALSSPAVVSSLESNFPSPSSSSSSSSSSQGLPPSIIAAIAVPTVVGAIFFAALTVFLILCIRKRNRRRRDSHNPAIGPYTSPYQQPPNNGNAYAYPDTYGVNKDFRAHSQNGVSPSHPSMSAVSPSFAGGGSPHPVAVAEMEGTDPYLAATNRYQQQYQQQQGSPARSPARSPAGSPALNRENLDALSKSGSQPRHSDELARERRLSGDGTTAVPEPSVAGRTNWTTDSFNVAGGRRGGY